MDDFIEFSVGCDPNCSECAINQKKLYQSLCEHVMDNDVRMGGTHPMTCIKCGKWFTYEEGLEYPFLDDYEGEDNG